MAHSRICKIDGCDKKVSAKKMCSTHYARWVRTGDPMKGTRKPRKTDCSIDGCEGGHFARDLCAKHYWRWQQYGDPLVTHKTPAGEPLRYINEVAIPYQGDDCLAWPFADNGVGYGVVSVDGRQTYAHRIVCEATHGTAPDERPFALHNCGNGHLGCVNPKHLRWGNQSENLMDCHKHGTSVSGERNNWAKLTDAEVDAILQNPDGLTSRQLAEQFNISQNYVTILRRGEGRIRTRSLSQ